VELVQLVRPEMKRPFERTDHKFWCNFKLNLEEVG
jgi:hypothetical protein